MYTVMNNVLISECNDAIYLHMPTQRQDSVNGEHCTRTTQHFNTIASDCFTVGDS